MIDCTLSNDLTRDHLILYSYNEHAWVFRKYDTDSSAYLIELTSNL